MWALLEKTGELDPTRNVLTRVFDLNVCPEGLISDETFELIHQEQISETYKTSPVAGGTEDWPYRWLRAFMIIRQTHNECQLEEIRNRKAE